MVAPRGSFEYFMKMKKKPALQAILDNLDSYTVEDLDKVSQALWIRNWLKHLKKSSTYNPSVEHLADLMQKATPIAKPPKFEARLYKGNTIMIRTNKSQVEISTGELFLILSLTPISIKLSTVLDNIDPVSFQMLSNNSETLGDMSVYDFIQFRQGVLSKKHGIFRNELIAGSSSEKVIGVGAVPVVIKRI